MFNEKAYEYSAKQGKDIPVFQTEKYKESKQKALDIIESGQYGVKSSDFWILMNETKSGKMAYSGLIISHNGCLKINDALPAEKRFDPECVGINENGYGNSLVFSYCNKAQGLFETGEVSAKNCKNDYPYAMAEKRLFDRVVLKNSKLAYVGIYGEDEADEFRAIPEEPDEKRDEKREETLPCCADCGQPITDYTAANGEKRTAAEIIEHSFADYGTYLCALCYKERKKCNSTTLDGTAAS